MKQTSLAAADYSSKSGQTRRSYVDRSWQSWYVGSEDHYEPLIVAYDYDILYSVKTLNIDSYQHIILLYYHLLQSNNETEKNKLQWLQYDEKQYE